MSSVFAVYFIDIFDLFKFVKQLCTYFTGMSSVGKFSYCNLSLTICTSFLICSL